jgi:predicted HicB family RNase H-like nuclease
VELGVTRRRDVPKQINLRVDEDTAARIDERAKKVGVTRNAWLNRAVRWALSQPVTTTTVVEEKV